MPCAQPPRSPRTGPRTAGRGPRGVRLALLDLCRPPDRSDPRLRWPAVGPQVVAVGSTAQEIVDSPATASIDLVVCILPRTRIDDSVLDQVVLVAGSFPTLMVDPEDRRATDALGATVAGGPDPGPAVDVGPLSRREHETLMWIGRGYTHQQTANRMGISKATVDTYVVRVRTKLGLGNKAELASAALRLGPAGAD